jgi:hypothetical protein
MKRSSLIFIVNISIILLIFFIGLAVQVAPYFTCSLLSKEYLIDFFVLANFICNEVDQP